jgi:hypothetical protein
MAATITSQPTVITFMDNCAYQIDIATTNSTGTFSVQASVDYVPADGIQTAVAGHWVDLPLGGGTPSAAAANDDILIYLNQLPFTAIRLVYTSTVAGTGIMNAFVMLKQIGG